MSVLVDRIVSAADPARYLKSHGFEPHEWQAVALDTSIQRLLLNCARQAGKSTITAGMALHQAKSKTRSLVLIFSPTERQSKELMEKIQEFINRDQDLRLVEDSVHTKRFDNGSRIVALPGKESTIRGFSGPDMVIIDEASRVEDALYRAVRPMMVGSQTRLIAMSTPFGTRGWWYDEWTHNDLWTKVLVTAPVQLKYDEVVPVDNEEDFRKAWSKMGVKAFYSARHTLQFMKEEYRSMPEWWYRQEYFGEFLDSDDAVFRSEDLDFAFNAGSLDDLTTLFEEEEQRLGQAEVFTWDRM